MMRNDFLLNTLELVSLGQLLMYFALSAKSVDIFARSGHPRRLMQLQSAFEAYHGSKYMWNGYTIYDGAVLLLRYLKSLPESVIRLAYHGKFIEEICPFGGFCEISVLDE